jgi:hypothetical protein
VQLRTQPSCRSCENRLEQQVVQYNSRSMPSDIARKQLAKKRRELRCALPPEKWNWLDTWLNQGVAQTYAQLILLSLEALEQKLRDRRLSQRRLEQIEPSEGTHE